MIHLEKFNMSVSVCFFSPGGWIVTRTMDRLSAS